MNELTDLTVAVMPWVMVNSLLVCTLIAMVFFWFGCVCWAEAV